MYFARPLPLTIRIPFYVNFRLLSAGETKCLHGGTGEKERIILGRNVQGGHSDSVSVKDSAS